MGMVGKVVAGMTLRAVSCQSYRSVGRCVMTGCTTVMLLVVGCIDKVGVIDCLGMAATTFCLQRYLGRMVLSCVSRKVARYTAMTLRTVARQSYRGVGCCVMTGGTAVMLEVVARIYKGSIIHRGAVTAYTTRSRRYLGCMILRRMGGEVGSYTTMTL
jgi:hypothetical protein